MKLLAILLSLVACAAPARATAPVERTASGHDLASVYGYAANNPVTHTDRRGTALDGYPRPEEKKAMEAGKDERNAAAREAAVGAIPIYGPARAASAAFSAAIDAHADGRNVEAAAHAAGGVGNSILAIAPLVGAVTATASSAATMLADDAFVVRGGVTTPEQLAKGIGPHRDIPGLTGFSAQSKPGATVHELSATGGVGGGPFPHGQVSVTTVGELRCIGCDVVPSPGGGANHVTVTPGPATPAAISEVFTQMPNPARRP